MTTNSSRDRDPTQQIPARPSMPALDHAAKSTDRTSMLFTYGIFFARSGGRRLLGWTKVHAGYVALGFIVMTAPELAGTINFTPRPSTYEVEGRQFPNVAFSDGQKTVVWTPPVGWEINGSAGRLALKPPNASQAVSSFSAIELREPIPVNDQNISKFVEIVVASLPRESDKPEVLAATLNPLRICGHETVDIIIRYALSGQPYCKSVLFLARGREQFRFELMAHQNEFTKLHGDLQKSLYSMQGL